MPDEPNWAALVDHLVSKHVEPTLIEPTMLHDYPVELSPFAKRHREHEGLVERFEAFADGMEFANAFSELNDPDDQKARFEEQVRHAAAGDENAPPFDYDYIYALEHGMPPTGGIGFGIDRLGHAVDRPADDPGSGFVPGVEGLDQNPGARTAPLVN